MEHIPNYGLYGESQGSVAPGIHIEEIEERSRGQNWVIKPHRHGKLFQILSIFYGESAVQLDDKRYQVTGWSLVTIPIGVVHSFSFKPNSEGVVVTLSEETLASIYQFQGADYLRPVLEHAAVIDIKEDYEQRQQLQKYLALMRYEFSAANDAKFASLLLLVNLLLISIKRQIDYQTMDAANAPPNLRTFAVFRRLVETHYREQWQVADYATALNISTSTLNRMCHERFGSNAKSIIMARLIAEAKRRLVYTRQPVDQIAYYLGYRDPAYFSRVFKKLEQQSPSDYRREKQL